MKVKTRRSINLNSGFSILRGILGNSIGLAISMYNTKSFLLNNLLPDIITSFLRILILIIFLLLSVYFIKKITDLVLDLLNSKHAIVKGKISSTDYMPHGGYSSTITIRIDKQKFKFMCSKFVPFNYSLIKKIRGNCILSYYPRTRIPISIQY